MVAVCSASDWSFRVVPRAASRRDSKPDRTSPGSRMYGPPKAESKIWPAAPTRISGSTNFTKIAPRAAATTVTNAPTSFIDDFFGGSTGGGVGGSCPGGGIGGGTYATGGSGGDADAPEVPGASDVAPSATGGGGAASV